MFSKTIIALLGLTQIVKSKDSAVSPDACVLDETCLKNKSDDTVNIDLTPAIVETLGETAHLVSLPPDFSETMLDYCDDMLFCMLLRELDRSSASKDVDNDFAEVVNHQGFPFGVSRHANHHFVHEPASDAAHRDVLQHLSDANMDSVLRGIGQTLSLSSLEVSKLQWETQASSAATPEGQKGVLHLIVPMVEEGSTGPDLKLSSPGADEMVYPFQEHGAWLLKDDAVFSTTVPSVDDAETPIILSITLLADSINTTKAESDGPHWVRGNEESNLPELTSDGEHFASDYLEPLQMESVTWARSGKEALNNGYRMGLESKLRSEIVRYFSHAGFLEALYSWTYGENKEQPGFSLLGGQEWMVQTTDEAEETTGHFILPATPASHNDFLKALSSGGFDEVLEAVGKRFNLEGLLCVHVSLLVFSDEAAFLDNSNSEAAGDKGFQLLVPLSVQTEEDDAPGLEIHDKDDFVMGHYSFQLDEGLLVSGGKVHNTITSFDAEDFGNYRFCASFYLADVSESNVRDVVPKQYLTGYPYDDESAVVADAAGHWDRDDKAKKLPSWENSPYDDEAVGV